MAVPALPAAGLVVAQPEELLAVPEALLDGPVQRMAWGPLAPSRRTKGRRPAPLLPNPTDSPICRSNTTWKLLLRRETMAKGVITAQCKQAGWNNEYLLKVLSN